MPNNTIDIKLAMNSAVPAVLTLGQLLHKRRDSAVPVSWIVESGNSISLATLDNLRQQVTVLMASFQGKAGEKWALYCEDSYSFLIAFLAMLHSDITPVLPMNIQENTVGSLVGRVDGLVLDAASSVETNLLPTMILAEKMGESGSAETGSGANTPYVEEDFSSRLIEIYTSGSTGEPEVIVKNIGQFESEVATLESCWGSVLTNVAHVATVSHQHIYGLLFRLLWPVCTGRAFFAKRFEFPEEMGSIIKRYKALTQSSVVVVSSPAHIKRVSASSGLSGIGVVAPITFSSGGPLDINANLGYQSIVASQIVEVFGSSETGGVAYRMISAEADESERLYWMPFNTVEVAESDGLLKVKSPHSLPYESSQTQKPPEEGWYQTSDKVTIFADGRFLLHGRADRIAKIEEKRISLSGVEALLDNHDWVKESKVIVIEGGRQCLGVVACLSCEGVRQLESQKKSAMVRMLRKHLAATFDAVVLPRKWRFVEELPINAQGKTVVADLRMLFSLDNSSVKENIEKGEVL